MHFSSSACWAARQLASGEQLPTAATRALPRPDAVARDDPSARTRREGADCFREGKSGPFLSGDFEIPHVMRLEFGAAGMARPWRLDAFASHAVRGAP